MNVMKNMKYTILGLFAMATMASCSTIVPVAATNNPIGSKKGRSSTTILFGTANRANLGAGIVLNKNYGVIEAVKKGKITNLATVDLKVTSYGIFVKAEILVTGE